jgi:hypothetical protein
MKVKIVVVALASLMPTLARAQQGPAAQGATVVVSVQPQPMQPVVIAQPQPMQPVYVAPAPAGPPVMYMPPPGARLRRVSTPYDGGPIPPGGRIVSRANYALVGVGAGALLLGWIAAILQWEILDISCYGGLYGSYSCSTPSLLMFVPVAGPWLAYLDPNTANRAGPGLAIEGVLQDAGLALLIVGLASRRQFVVTQQWADGSHRRHGVEWTVAPSIGQAPGMSVIGAF